jgi:hypothetical protein
LAFTLSGNGRAIKYSDRERDIFRLLPQDGKTIDTNKLVQRYYRKQIPNHPGATIIGTMRSFMRKIERNKEPFRIKKSVRAGPYPIEFWIEPIR